MQIHVNEQKISLGGEWSLTYADERQLLSDGYRSRTDGTLSTPKLATEAALRESGYTQIPACVPGNFELELERAGILPEIFLGTNVLEVQKYETVHQYYSRSFEFSGDFSNTVLRFEGIDTAAEIFLNGESVLVAENMFLVYDIPVEGKLREGRNELVVHIKPATLYARQFPIDISARALPYNMESLWMRKAASSYGWDIMPRTVGGGIWREVSLVTRPVNRIEEFYGYTLGVVCKENENYARLRFSYATVLEDVSTEGWSLSVEGVCGDSRFEGHEAIHFVAGMINLRCEDPLLWMPRNYGEPNLYDVTVKLLCKDKVMDVYRFRMGIRTVELERTSTTDREGNGEFLFRVNGQRIFCMGTNWVPVDAFHSRDRERLPEILPMLNDLGCNMVRCWGGNVYEDEIFYDFCDANGILVWQDFGMACGIYPQRPAFAERLAHEVEEITKRLRQHPSIILWAGDNECDQAYASGSSFYRDPNTNRLTRHVIPEVLAMTDMTRPYLPSSPYMDEEAYRSKKKTSEEHAWGPRDYFKGKYYSNVVAHFVSETGYHGCPLPSSVERFITPEHRWDWHGENGEGNDPEWQVHAAAMETSPDCIYAYRIPLMANQVETLFGSNPDNLTDFAMQSQISQAEAKKFFIERFRLKKWRHTGVLWWNLIDGWPQFSDAVVDYYYGKKLAYYYIRRSQNPICMMFDEPKEGRIALYAVNDTRNDATLTYRVTNLTTGETVLAGSVHSSSDASVETERLAVGENEQSFFLIEWSYSENGIVKTGKNHFMSGMPRIDYAEYLRCMRVAGYMGNELFSYEG